MKLETNFSRGLFSEVLLQRPMGSIFKECDHLNLSWLYWIYGTSSIIDYYLNQEYTRHRNNNSNPTCHIIDLREHYTMCKDLNISTGIYLAVQYIEKATYPIFKFSTP